MNSKQISAAKTSELVELYNELTGKNIKKFSSRAAAEKQVAAAVAAQDAARKPGKKDAPVVVAEEKAPKAPKVAKAAWVRGTCPGCGAGDDAGCITAAGLEGTTAGETRNFCHSCSTEWNRETGKIYKAPAASASRSAGIAKSWADTQVREARSARHGVRVMEGTKLVGEFRSVRAAFTALGLPDASHIKFRMALKTELSKKWAQYTFKIIEA